MSFLTWAALAIGALVVIPILAHLLRRRPPDELAFAATDLVPATPAVAQRRTAIEDRALFVIRVLAVLALAVLGATPFVTCARLSLAGSSGAGGGWALVLDYSLSLRARGRAGSSETRFERSLRGARELLSGLQAGDAVAVVLAGKPARVPMAATTNLDAAAAVLSKIAQTDRGTDLVGAVKIAGDLLEDLQHVDKRVVVLSDLAAGLEGAEKLLAPAGARLWIPLEQLRGAIDDCAVIHADRTAGDVSVRVACSPKAIEVNSQRSGTAKRRIAIVGAGKALVEAPLGRAEPVDEIVLKLPQSTELHKVGQLYAELRGGDAIAQDDSAPVVAVGAELGVGIVSDPANDQVATGGPPVVEQAFKALRREVQLRPLPIVPGVEELKHIGLLIVDDVPGFTPTQRRGIARWVEAGGVLLITLGPHAAAAPIGSGFRPMLRAIVRWKPAAVEGLTPEKDRLFGEAFPGLDKLAPKGRAQLELEANSRHTVLARWSDGAPFVLERRLGRGVVYALTLPLSTLQSDFSLRPGFLALLGQLTKTARALGGVARTTIGPTWRLDGFREVSVVKLAPEESQSLPLEVRAGPGQARRAVVDTIGSYQLKLDDNTSVRVAAVDETELHMVTRPIAGEQGAGELGGSSAKVDVSAEIALFLLALLFVELLLRALGPRLRRRRDPTLLVAGDEAGS